MRVRIALLAALATCAAIAVLFAISASGSSKGPKTDPEAVPGTPSVEIVAPRNGSRQRSHAVVVKVKVHNFRLSPRHFGGDPELAEGHIRFSLKRVPDCVDPVKLERALNSPIGGGRLQGKSFDYPAYSGPNGILADRNQVAGSYSPATRPEIFYHELPAGFYRLVVALAQNDGATTPYHAVTNFQIVPRPGHEPKPCKKGKVSSAKAATLR